MHAAHKIELDLIELEKQIGPNEVNELLAAAGMTTERDPGDFSSVNGRGRETLVQRETLGQHLKTDADRESSAVTPISESVCNEDSILRNEAMADCPWSLVTWN
jgi:hypothetical protein